MYYSKRAMRLVAEDALAEFPTTPVSIESPCGPCPGCLQSSIVADATNLCAVSIVRSGDALLESVRELVPGCKVGKILIQRDESHPNKLPKLFYSKLPTDIQHNNMFVLLCDPMLATGGSAVTALDVLVKGHGVDPTKIIFANMICAPEGLQVLAEAYPNVKIVTAVIDQHLNEDKFIVPGLGDYGDRFFNTE